MNRCLNCGKETNKRICKPCMDTMPKHIKPFANDKIYNLIDKVSRELEKVKK